MLVTVEDIADNTVVLDMINIKRYYQFHIGNSKFEYINFSADIWCVCETGVNSSRLFDTYVHL